MYSVIQSDAQPGFHTAWVHQAGNSMGFEHTLVAKCKRSKIRAKKDTGWHAGILDCLLSQRKLQKWIKHRRWPTTKKIILWPWYLKRAFIKRNATSKTQCKKQRSYFVTLVFKCPHVPASSLFFREEWTHFLPLPMTLEVLPILGRKENATLVIYHYTNIVCAGI